MTLDRNDPRWTAYVLDELDARERSAFEEEMAADPRSHAMLDEIREAVLALQEGFGSMPPVELTPAQRREIVHAAAAPAAAMPRAGEYGYWKVAVGVAAALLMGAITVIMGPELLRPAEPVETAVRVTPPAVEPGTGPNIPAEDAPPAAIALNEAAALNEPGPTSADAALAAAPDAESSARAAQGESAAAPAVLPAQAQPGRLEADAAAALAGASEIAQFAREQGFAPALENATVSRSVAAFPTAPPAPGAPDRPAPRFNTEEYSRIVDNGFVAVARDPLATFSADVDTASYANVRRFLNQRVLPPPDAVRIEEMINYFTYDYAPPVDGRPIRVHAETAAAPWQPAHRLVRVGVKGREIARDARSSSNLVFLIDVSGSMNDADKLPLLKESMKLLVDQLGENDRVAIVVYAGASGLALPSTPGHRKGEILRALDRLSAGGSTNGGAGIRLAYQVAVSNFIAGGVNRVILATDGDFNVGVTNTGELTRLIEDEARSGVFLTILGFGTGNYNDAGMEAMAGLGNGNYAYIDGLREARKVLVEQIGGTLETIARDVKLQVEFNPAEVQAYRLIGYENRLLEDQDFNDDQKDAGDMGAGHTVTALFEVVPHGVNLALPEADPLRYQQPTRATDRAGSGELLTVSVRYKEPGEEESRLLEVPVVDRGQDFRTAGADFRFAAAVAEFGMVLRDSPHRGSASFDSALRNAESSLGADREGYRAEFVDLVRRARAIRDLGR